MRAPLAHHSKRARALRLGVSGGWLSIGCGVWVASDGRARSSTSRKVPRRWPRRAQTWTIFHFSVADVGPGADFGGSGKIHHLGGSSKVGPVVEIGAVETKSCPNVSSVLPSSCELPAERSSGRPFDGTQTRPLQRDPLELPFRRRPDSIPGSPRVALGHRSGALARRPSSDLRAARTPLEPRLPGPCGSGCARAARLNRPDLGPLPRRRACSRPGRDGRGPTVTLHTLRPPLRQAHPPERPRLPSVGFARPRRGPRRRAPQRNEVAGWPRPFRASAGSPGVPHRLGRAGVCVRAQLVAEFRAQLGHTRGTTQGRVLLFWSSTIAPKSTADRHQIDQRSAPDRPQIDRSSTSA